VTTGRVTALLLLVAALLAGSFALGALARFRLVSIGESVLGPPASPGSLVLAEVVPVIALRAGDIIEYRHPSRATQPLFMRVLENPLPVALALPERGGRIVRLRGDPDHMPETWDAELHGTALRMRLAVARLGWVARREVQLAAAILLGVLLSVSHLAWGRRT